tara:strand:- start:4507 stop:5376 length:870 start_codon:yes stop_codon:yes gene_type:complete
MKDLDLDIIAAKIARQVLLEEMDLEKEKQDAIAGEIKKSDLKAEPSKKDSTEKRLTDEAEDDEAEDDEEEIKAKPKPDSGSDDEDDESFEVESDVADIPKNVNFDEVKKQINNLRAGGSLKDEQISDQLKDYFDKLGKAETKALYVYLSSVASILTGGTPGAEAPRPSDADIDLSIEKKKEKETSAPVPGVDGEGAQAPIIVGERANNNSTKMMLLEMMTADDDHRCTNGKVVKFGSPKCILDLQDRLEDVVGQRDACARGTADRVSLNGMLNYLRQKLRKAKKISLMK